MEDDMRLSNILPPDRLYKKSSFLTSPTLTRYLMIKYEELVKDPASRLQMLYDFAGLRMTAKAYEFLYETTHGERLEGGQTIPRIDIIVFSAPAQS